MLYVTTNFNMINSTKMARGSVLVDGSDISLCRNAVAPRLYEGGIV